MKEKEKFFIDLHNKGIIIVSPYGTIFNVKTNRYIGAVSNRGYYKISIKDHIANKIRHISIHRLVYLIYIGDIQDTINHKDLNRLNNFYKNLEDVTNKENTKHAIENGHTGNRFKMKNKCAYLRKSIGNRYTKR